ncbi:DUF4331 family protein [Methylocapsa acidiphila]|uniref:DUF4331 domain-containing protein n=1 Tax=Methylocapsa acidiphila TaxID=133552 RepID=Q2VNN4_METAI|nr:DUF4331 family protein [Methylocapsa acidiphila]CAJ01598.1 hypothetical protein orf30 [Methylocapsa acidiphila]
MKRLGILFAFIGIVLASSSSRASDHADPMWLPEDEQEANITGLFFFPDGDQMVAILDVRRSLTGPPPYNLEPFEYNINMDLHSKVTFDNAEDVARYGGSIPSPEMISPDVTIRFRLNNDTSVKEQSFKGLKDPEKIRVYTGVRDDPFIFPKFFKVNVITMVLSIPKSSFPDNQQNWLLWATTNRVNGGEQIDHVGRSNRTQLGRFDFLNTIPPNEQVAAIKDRSKSRAMIQDFLKNWAPPLANLNQLSGFLIRHYDYVPDVMVYTNQRPSGFPNGRRLEDDVSYLTCQQGDCPLQENSFIDSNQWPRATVNDKPLLKEFPYLAEPWPYHPQAPGAMGPYVVRFLSRPGVLWGIAAIVLALIIGLFLLRRRKRSAYS